VAAEPVEAIPTPPAPAPEPEPVPVPAPEPAPAPAPAAKADNLQLIKGLGPKLAGLLNGLGVSSFQQIADWTDADIAAIDPQLGAFQGRIARDNFVDQAGYLARGDKAGFEAKYGALGGEL
jgi:predicted flap endonuclease-1-like 5' DNA nuclease